MSKTAILTDTNSSMTQKEADAAGIYLLHMTFTVNEKDYKEGIDLTQEQFYKMLAEPHTTVSPTQPSPGELTELWDSILQEYEEIAYTPMF